jgi:hypothetical protein
MTRYALYFAPPPGAFAETAARWLGRALPAISGDLWPLTASARRYGFHATLKAPFRLEPGLTESDLIAAMDRFGATCAPVDLAGLGLADLDGFLALIPQGDTGPLNDLAARVVRDFDPLRAPLTPADIARRNPDRLTPRQRALLDQWGYPFVLDEFRFHMTLTDRLAPGDAAWVLPLARACFAAFTDRPLRIDALSLYVEAPDGLFHPRHRAPLSGP